MEKVWKKAKVVNLCKLTVLRSVPLCYSLELIDAVFDCAYWG